MTKSTRPHKKALGKGFESLLGPDTGKPVNDQKDNGASANENDNAIYSHSQSTKKLNSVLELPVNAIKPNPQQPRRIFRDEELSSLVQSIKQDGVIQPIIVTRCRDTNEYHLIAGERRLRASKLSGKTTVPAILKELHDEEILRVALIENIQRADLTVIEEAKAYKSLMEDYGLTQESVAEKVGKDRTTVTNAVRLLNLPNELQNDLLHRRLSMGHGRALLSLEDKKTILKARDIVISKSLSVRQTESLCKRVKKSGATAEDAANSNADSLEHIKSADLDHLAEHLRSVLRTKVKLAGSGSKGKIEISYFSASELERILDAIGVKL